MFAEATAARDVKNNLPNCTRKGIPYCHFDGITWFVQRINTKMFPHRSAEEVLPEPCPCTSVLAVIVLKVRDSKCTDVVPFSLLQN